MPISAVASLLMKNKFAQHANIMMFMKVYPMSNGQTEKNF